MSRPLRLEFEGATWHITARGNEKKDIYRDDADRERFLDFLAQAVTRYKWRLHDYMEMTNHYHLTIETPETTLSRGMQWLNSKYASYFNRKYDRVGHLFQGRFKGCLVDSDTYFLRLCRYVVRNPVRAGMVQHAGQWKWSSYQAKAGMVTAPSWLTLSPTLAYFHPSDEAESKKHYRDYINAPDADEWRPWEDLRNQLYLGSEEWMAKIQERIDRSPRSSDHPRAQRHPFRPRMDEIIAAVARTFELTPKEVCHRGGGKARALVAHLGVHEGIHFRRTIGAELGVGCSRVSSLLRECQKELEDGVEFTRLAMLAREKLNHRAPPGRYVARRAALDIVREPSASYFV